jgi:hypothetical protein
MWWFVTGTRYTDRSAGPRRRGTGHDPGCRHFHTWSGRHPGNPGNTGHTWRSCGDAAQHVVARRGDTGHPRDARGRRTRHRCEAGSHSRSETRRCAGWQEEG